jgi:hypothetical protein
MSHVLVASWYRGPICVASCLPSFVSKLNEHPYTLARSQPCRQHRRRQRCQRFRRRRRREL